MTTSRMKKSATALLAAGAVLALASCSVGAGAGDGAPADAQAQGALFEFQTSTYGNALDGELTIRVPDALVAAAGADAEGLLVAEYRTSPHELGGAEYCGIDVEVVYADAQAQESAGQSASDDASTQEKIDEAEQQVYRVFGVADQAELTSWFQQRLAGDGLTEEEQMSDLRMEYYHFVESKVDGGMAVNAAVQALLDEVTKNSREGADEQAAMTPAEHYGLTLANSSDASPLDDLDDASPERGVYVSDDGTRLTLVVECASDPGETGGAQGLRFPVRHDGEVETFARVDLIAMKSGSVVVSDSEVEDYAIDSQGNWIAD